MKGVFFHIPKNAGTNTKKIIEKISINKPLTIENFPLVQKEINNTFEKYSSSPRECLIFYKLIKDEYFTFTFVRNPWDRAVSAYKWLMDHPRRRTLFNGKILNENLSFKEFVKFIPMILNADYKHYNNLKWHLEPQHTQIVDENGKIKVDYIGRVENYNEELENILIKLEIPLKDEYFETQFNKTSRKEYHCYYDDETRQIIQEIYKKDIELFNYNF